MSAATLAVLAAGALAAAGTLLLDLVWRRANRRAATRQATAARHSPLPTRRPQDLLGDR